jgi:hypothetical protein
VNAPLGDRRYRGGGPRKGYVYFIAPEALFHRAPDSEGRIAKIGFTTASPFERLKALQTGSPLILKVWAYVRGTEQLEAALHLAFDGYRSHGEWFHVEGPLADLLYAFAQEPNTGRLIDEEELEGAIHDNVFTGMFDGQEGEEPYSRVKAESLAGFFPDAWMEALT